MLEKVCNTIDKFNLLNENDTVFIGLSGGADSVCLLLCMLELSKKYRISVKAIHINHCLRGDESLRDENFCAELCRKLNVPISIKHIDVKSYATEKSLSCEEAARILRYDAFLQIAGNNKIATAHSLSDNLETILYNLTRGTALKGLCGIPPKRSNIIRPLLNLTRQEIENFLLEKNQPFVTDSTNLSDMYTRNKIRHNAVPVLKSINENIYSSVSNMTDVLSCEDDFLNQQTMLVLNNSALPSGGFANLDKYHTAIRKRCIVHILKNLNLPYNFERVSDIDNIILNGGKIQLSDSVYIICRQGILYTESTDKYENTPFYSVLKEGDNIFKNSKICSVKTFHRAFTQYTPKIHRKFADYYLDCDKIIGETFMRNRKNGDKIVLAGRNFTSSVKKLLNAAVPLEKRDNIVFIEDEKGIIFIEKIGIADRVKVSDETNNIMQITVKELTSYE